MYACIYLYTYVYVYMYTYIYIHTYLWISVRCSLPPSGFMPTKTCTSVWSFGLDLQNTDWKTNWIYRTLIKVGSSHASPSLLHVFSGKLLNLMDDHHILSSNEHKLRVYTHQIENEGYTPTIRLGISNTTFWNAPTRWAPSVLIWFINLMNIH